MRIKKGRVTRWLTEIKDLKQLVTDSEVEAQDMRRKLTAQTVETLRYRKEAEALRAGGPDQQKEREAAFERGRQHGVMQIRGHITAEMAKVQNVRITGVPPL